MVEGVSMQSSNGDLHRVGVKMGIFACMPCMQQDYTGKMEQIDSNQQPKHKPFYQQGIFL
jgi:hypothetical protein